MALMDESVRCKNCSHWGLDRVYAGRDEKARLKSCSSDAFRISYFANDTPDNGVDVESDEGWGFFTGPEFGCVHFNLRASASLADAHFVGLVKLANPYGEGNHHRMSWRRAWDVDCQAMTARHRDSEFLMVFSPCPQGGYTATVGGELPPFGPDGELAMAQMFGLRQLLKDGWDIWHTVVAKKRC